jgi:predicted DNA-binding protein (MmcQ/YjbR family)
MARKASSDAALEELRAFGLAYPGAHTKSPWPGHLDLAVKDKTFAYLTLEGEPFSIGCKLPQSCSVALMLPFTKPTAYGLGKSGWVTANPPPGRAIPVEMFKEWIDESYRAQAPKTLLKQLLTAPGDVAPAKAKKSRANKPAAKKPAVNKSAAKKR